MKVLEYGKDDLESVLNRSSIDYSETIDKVKEIVGEVRKRGDEAVLDYTKKFDGVKPENIRVPEEKIDEAISGLNKNVLKALKHAHQNIKSFHTIQYQGIEQEWEYMIDEGVIVGERIRPIQNVGCYVPGGLAPYPSSILMTATPAKVVGVERVVVASPAKNITESVLAACKIAGVDEVYQVGGAQAVAALAYGTKTIKPVEKIVGPGNKYVQAAKMLVFGVVDIDMPAGPSEVLIVADKSANTSYVASDVLAQAEHDPNAQCVVVTDSKKVVDEVQEKALKGRETSEKIEIIEKSWINFTIIKTKSVSESIDFANDYAAEHVEVMTEDSVADSKKIINAGAVFVGKYSPVAAGDYATGANHVLPTGKTAKFASQLSVRDYLKSMSVQNISKKGLEKIADTAVTIAQQEGLTEHKKSIEERFR